MFIENSLIDNNKDGTIHNIHVGRPLDCTFNKDVFNTVHLTDTCIAGVYAKNGSNTGPRSINQHAKHFPDAPIIVYGYKNYE